MRAYYKLAPGETQPSSYILKADKTDYACIGAACESALRILDAAVAEGAADDGLVAVYKLILLAIDNPERVK